MSVTVTSNDLRGRSSKERGRILREAYKRAISTPANGEIAEAAKVLREFEERNGMTTADLIAGLEAGTIAETNDICSWLFAADRKKRLDALKR